MAAVVEYIPRESFLHRLHPLAKMAWAVLVLCLAVIFSDYTYVIALFLTVLVTAAAGKVLPEIIRMFKGLFTFAFILFLMQVLFYNRGAVLFYLIPIGKGYIRITGEGILFSMAMAFRMLTIVTSFLVYLATTKTQDMVNTLVEKLSIPYDYAFMFLTAMRFIPTFLNEVKQIADAQKARGFVLEGWNPVKKIKAYLPIAVPLVLLSLKKAQHMALAMETRGYGTGERTHLHEISICATDIVFIVLMFIIFVGGIVIRLNGYGKMF